MAAEERLRRRSGALPKVRRKPPHLASQAFGIGMYLPPEWTLPRVAGALLEL